jgi:hypothetical protein
MIKVYTTTKLGDLSTSVGKRRIVFSSNSIKEHGLFSTTDKTLQDLIESDKDYGVKFTLAKGYSKNSTKNSTKDNSVTPNNAG